MNGGETDQEKRVKWRQSLEAAILHQEIPIQAKTCRKGWRTKSEPVLLQCEDKNIYVVKGQQAGRQIVNDQIVARLGLAIDAPVGKAKIIYVSQELIDIEPNLSNFMAGTAHGTQFIPDCRDEWELIATSEPDNRPRLARLAVLYGWTYANDHQFLFQKSPPRLIYSVDHGHFFPNGSEWQENDLKRASRAEIDSILSSKCNFTANELQEALEKLEMVTEDDIIRVVAVPPQEWQFTMEERITMVDYLIRRQQELLKLL